jgi:integrase
MHGDKNSYRKLAAQAAIPASLFKRWLGHADSATTQKVYGHQRHVDKA